MIVRGSLERLAPVLMTAMTAIIGLVPLALGAGQTGKEILHPLAIVVIGGPVAPTLALQLLTPPLFFPFFPPPEGLRTSRQRGRARSTAKNYHNAHKSHSHTLSTT